VRIIVVDVARLCQALDIAPGMAPGLGLYLAQGVKPGGFLCAVLRGDAEAARLLADESNKARMDDGSWARLLEILPPECHGSPERFAAWRAHAGASAQGPAPGEPSYNELARALRFVMDNVITTASMEHEAGLESARALAARVRFGDAP
jgi:hypothetical protein